MSDDENITETAAETPATPSATATAEAKSTATSATETKSKIKITAEEFVLRLLDCAENHKTVYVQGAFGAPLVTTPWDNVARYTVKTQNAYNLKHAKAIGSMADDGYFAFDCVCLVKGILWGWNADASKRYGGAEYAANSVPDVGTEQMIAKCSGVSDDFAHVDAGELLWKNGHVGVSVGGGLAVECTPSYDGGVQVTAIKNIGEIAGRHSTTWSKHGFLPWVDYSTNIPDANDDSDVKLVSVDVAVIKKGVKCEFVKSMQALLNLRCGAGLDVDGSCGALTDNAIRAFQAARGLDVDGSCGALTWAQLLG